MNCKPRVELVVAGADEVDAEVLVAHATVPRLRQKVSDRPLLATGMLPLTVHAVPRAVERTDVEPLVAVHGGRLACGHRERRWR